MGVKMAQEIDIVAVLKNWEKIPGYFFLSKNENIEEDKLIALMHDLISNLYDKEPDVDELRNILDLIEDDTRKMLLVFLGLMDQPEIKKNLQESNIDPKTFITDFLKSKIISTAKSLSELFPISKIHTDIDRREEIVRKLAKIFDFSIQGEDAEDSETRYLQVDSESLRQVEEEIRDKIQKALEEARKREAAAKANRE